MALKAVVNGAKHRNESRYRGAGRHWATPLEVFQPLDEEFGFTLDPCATHQTAKCELYFTEAEDGLLQDWSGQTVFMNPPYGAEIKKWIEKAYISSQSLATVVGLLPAATDSDWWHRYVVGKAEIRYLRKRPRFLVYEDGSVKWASPFQPCVVVIWRPS